MVVVMMAVMMRVLRSRRRRGHAVVVARPLLVVVTAVMLVVVVVMMVVVTPVAAGHGGEIVGRERLTRGVLRPFFSCLGLLHVVRSDRLPVRLRRLAHGLLQNVSNSPNPSGGDEDRRDSQQRACRCD